MDNEIKIISLECLLKVGDHKGRISIPVNILSMLNLQIGSLVELMYLGIDYQHEVFDFNASLLPYKETKVLSSQNRFQISKNTQEYLQLEKDDYIKAIVSNPASYQNS